MLLGAFALVIAFGAMSTGTVEAREAAVAPDGEKTVVEHWWGRRGSRRYGGSRWADGGYRGSHHSRGCW